MLGPVLHALAWMLRAVLELTHDLHAQHCHAQTPQAQMLSYTPPIHPISTAIHHPSMHARTRSMSWVTVSASTTVTCRAVLSQPVRTNTISPHAHDGADACSHTQSPHLHSSSTVAGLHTCWPPCPHTRPAPQPHHCTFHCIWRHRTLPETDPTCHPQSARRPCTCVPAPVPASRPSLAC